MKKIANILYINLISIVCIIVNIISFVLNIVSTFIEKLFILPFGAVVVVCINYISTFALEKTDNRWISVGIFIIGIFLLITIMEILIATLGGLLMFLFKALAQIFSIIGDKLEEVFGRLVESIVKINNKGNNVLKRENNKFIKIACFCFYIMEAIYLGINKLFKLSIFIGGVISAISIFFMYRFINGYFLNTQSLGLFDYIKSLETLAGVFCSIQIILLLIIVISVIMISAFECTLVYLKFEQQNYKETLKRCNRVIENI